MPNKRTKTSLIRKPHTYPVPPICISKPTGVSCFLRIFDCFGVYKGSRNYGAGTLSNCQFIAGAQSNCKAVMYYSNPPQGVFVHQVFDNCGTPPPTPQPFSQATSVLVEEHDYYKIWETTFIGVYDVYIDPDTQIANDVSGVLIRYYQFLFNGTFSTTIYTSASDPDPTYEIWEWQSGYVIPMV